MLSGDPRLDREVRAEIRTSGQRRRRSLIVVAIVGALLLALLAVAVMTTPVASAQSQEPSPHPQETASPAATEGGPTPAVAQRVEVLDPGIAVSIPPDWTVEEVYGETRATSPDGVICLPAGSRIDEPVPDPDEVVDEVAAIYPHFSDDGPLPVVDKAEVMLPVGRSIRLVVDFALRPDDADTESEDGRFLTTYILSDGNVLAFFTCWGDERPADDWLAIAETFEYLPSAE